MKKIVFGLMLLLSMMSAFALNVEVLTTDPAPIVAGDYADITIQIENEQEDPVFDVVVDITENEFVSSLTQAYEISRIQSGQSVTRTFRVFFSDDLAQGNINVEFSVQEEGALTTQDISLFVQESERLPELYIGSIKSTPDELVPDSDDNELQVSILNLGDKDAELVQAKLVSNAEYITSSYSFSMTDAISSIAAGSEGIFTFTIDIDKDARGEIPANIELRYRAKEGVGNSYTTFTQMLEMPIQIIDSPYLEIVEVKQLDSFESGSTDNRIQLTVQNNGESDAEEVRVRVLPDISYPLIFELTTEYVGSRIKPGEKATVQFDIEVFSETPANNFSITAQLESLVGEARYTQDDEFFISTSQGVDTNTQQIGLIAIIAVIIISVIIGWNVLRSKSKKK